MKRITIIIILAILLTSCATTSTNRATLSKPVTKVEYTFKQNWINLGVVVLGAGLQVLGYSLMLNKMGSEIGNGIREGMHRY